MKTQRVPLDLTPVEVIERTILLLRGQKVILDADLARLYGVTTKRLNEQVKRNHDRFPEDFMFRLTRDEVKELNRSQFATGSQKHRDPRFAPYVFTEHGAVMLANVLNSRSAIRASIHVVRAFVRIRQMIATHKDFAQKLEELEQKYEGHDADIKSIFQVIRKLLQPPVSAPAKRRIGFTAPDQASKK